jgi:hypothetical protein
MPNQYRALVGFSCPADPESLKNVEAAKKVTGEKREQLLSKVKWMDVKEGDKVVPYNEAILKSWLLGAWVEEVKQSG